MYFDLINARLKFENEADNEHRESFIQTVKKIGEENNQFVMRVTNKTILKKHETKQHTYNRSKTKASK